MSTELQEFLEGLGPGVDVESVLSQMDAAGVQFPEELGAFSPRSSYHKLWQVRVQRLILVSPCAVELQPQVRQRPHLCPGACVL